MVLNKAMVVALSGSIIGSEAVKVKAGDDSDTLTTKFIDVNDSHGSKSASKSKYIIPAVAVGTLVIVGATLGAVQPWNGDDNGSSQQILPTPEPTPAPTFSGAPTPPPTLPSPPMTENCPTESYGDEQEYYISKDTAPNGCVFLDGNLVITQDAFGDDMGDFDLAAYLPYLQGVSGSVYVGRFNSNGDMTSFTYTGEYDLDVLGDFEVAGRVLEEIDLPNLRTVGGQFNLDFANFQLKRLNLPNLELVGGPVQLDQLERLNEMNFDKLQLIGNGLRFRGAGLSPESTLDKISFPSLQSVGFGVAQEFWTSVRAVECHGVDFEFPALESVTGSIDFYLNSDIGSVDFSKVKSMTDGSTFSNNNIGFEANTFRNGSVVDFSSLETIGPVGGSTTDGEIRFERNDNVRALDFSSLREAGKFKFGYNGELKTVEFPELESMTRIRVDGLLPNGGIEVLSLPKLKTVTDNVVFFASTGILRSLDVSSLETARHIYISGSSIEELNLPKLKATAMHLNGNNVLRTINAPELETMYGEDQVFETALFLENLGSLQNVNMPRLESIDGKFAIIGSTNAIASAGEAVQFSFPNLQTVTEEIKIQGNQALTAVDLSALVNYNTTKVDVDSNAQECACDCPFSDTC